MSLIDFLAYCAAYGAGCLIAVMVFVALRVKWWLGLLWPVTFLPLILFLGSEKFVQMMARRARRSL